MLVSQTRLETTLYLLLIANIVSAQQNESYPTVNQCKNQQCHVYSKCAIVGNVAKCKCNTECRNTSQSFVCGSDGMSYRSICHLEAIACRLKRHVTVSHHGLCDTSCSKTKCQIFAKCVSINGVSQCKCPSFKDCPKIPRPLCGTNGVTYYNHCHWKIMSCRVKEIIPIEKNGRCVKNVVPGKIRGLSEPKVVSCQTRSCPYYTLCREINGYPACVKICPHVKCFCQPGARRNYHQLNGCMRCFCEKIDVHTHL